VKVRDKSPKQKKMLVWRMSEGSTKGEWVEPAALSETSHANPPRVALEPWTSSSFDLLNGCEVTEFPDTAPGELFDDLFPPPQDRTKRR
jgi:hypothetical protein